MNTTDHTSPTRSISFGIARALDGPAASVVVDGEHLDIEISREEALLYVESARAQAMSTDSTLGAKSGVLLRASEPGVVRFEFLQGTADGRTDVTSRMCINSAVAALTLAVFQWDWSLNPESIVLYMDGRAFEAVAA